MKNKKQLTIYVDESVYDLFVELKTVHKVLNKGIKKPTQNLTENMIKEYYNAHDPKEELLKFFNKKTLDNK
tara:strand:- start:3907 stop:4119 length:213 start_codon:yes stop_codon:yes gene_type:complete